MITFLYWLVLVVVVVYLVPSISVSIFAYFRFYPRITTETPRVRYSFTTGFFRLWVWFSYELYVFLLGHVVRYSLRKGKSVEELTNIFLDLSPYEIDRFKLGLIAGYAPFSIIADEDFQ